MGIKSETESKLIDVKRDKTPSGKRYNVYTYHFSYELTVLENNNTTVVTNSDGVRYEKMPIVFEIKIGDFDKEYTIIYSMEIN